MKIIQNNKSKWQNNITQRESQSEGATESEWVYSKATLSRDGDLMSFQTVLGLNQGQEYTEESPYLVGLAHSTKMTV